MKKGKKMSHQWPGGRCRTWSIRLEVTLPGVWTGMPRGRETWKVLESGRNKIKVEPQGGSGHLCQMEEFPKGCGDLSWDPEDAGMKLEIAGKSRFSFRESTLLSCALGL